MNKDLEYLLATGDVLDFKTFAIVDNETEQVEYYVTQYDMTSALGPLNWWCTWKAPECKERRLWLRGSFYENEARARLYFPASLDTRIPPENRDGIEEWLQRYGLTQYDKWDIIEVTGGYHVNRLDHDIRVEARHCPYDKIHAIEEIVAEYQRILT